MVFLFKQVMKLRADAEAKLASFRRGDGCAFLDKLGAVTLEIEQQLARSTFSVLMGGKRFIAKLGLACAELEILGLADLNQVFSTSCSLSKVVVYNKIWVASLSMSQSC